MDTFLFFDLEATGLPKWNRASIRDFSNWPRIVSLGWTVCTESGETLGQSYSLVKPDGFEIPLSSVRIHGISTEQAESEGVPLQEALQSLLDDIEKFTPGLLVAHNIDFDRPTLLCELARCEMSHEVDQLSTFCTMQSTTDYCAIERPNGGYKWPSLKELHWKLFKEGFDDAHNAAADVAVCARCFFELRKMGLVQVRDRGEKAENQTEARGVDDEEAVDVRALIERILTWAKDRPTFNTDFVESLKEQFGQKGSLSPRQIAALQRMAGKWKVGGR